MAARNTEEAPLPMAAKLMVATNHGECQLLRDQITMVQDNTSIMVVAMASTGDASSAVRPPMPTRSMDNPLLLSLASRGDLASTAATVVEGVSVGNGSNRTMPLCQSVMMITKILKCFSNRPQTQQASHPAAGASSPSHTALHISPSNGIIEMQPAGSHASAGAGWSLEDLMSVITTEKDTALHVVATCGDGDPYLKSAEYIYNSVNYLFLAENKSDLLFAENNKGDTPLHCAVRAGNSRMVSCLIELASRNDCDASGNSRLVQLLRMENRSMETVLHEAVRIGNKDLITKLIQKDNELAKFPENGTSPLYLALLLGHFDIAEQLHDKTEGKKPSYSGPDGKNALHAVVLLDRDMTKKVLGWDKDLTKTADQDGSTPLHFAASLLFITRFQTELKNEVELVLEADELQLYQRDNEGSYPIHVAASSGTEQTVRYFIKQRPEVACFRDNNGRTFLHVAVARHRLNIVEYACHTPSLASILNMQDNDGNTALHIAVQHKLKHIFVALLKNRKVQLNIPNSMGQTPLDISLSKLTAGFSYAWNPDTLINRSLMLCNAKTSICRLDQYIQHLRGEKQTDELMESEKMTSSTQTLGIGSVLIVTVTFGALYALPGGYKSDDHFNGGTPTLARRYIFDAFIIANTIAFICSGLATINLMYAGMAMVTLPLRRRHFNISLFLAYSSVVSLGAAFALGMFPVLSPVVPITAYAICALMMIASLFLFTETLNGAKVAKATYVRMGNRILQKIARHVLFRLLLTYWPCLIIFGWAAISKKLG